jgi:hypothetical protein
VSDKPITRREIEDRYREYKLRHNPDFCDCDACVAWRGFVRAFVTPMIDHFIMKGYNMAIEVPYTILSTGGKDSKTFHEACVAQDAPMRQGAGQVTDLTVNPNAVCDVCGGPLLSPPSLRRPTLRELEDRKAALERDSDRVEAEIRKALDNEGKGPRGAHGELLTEADEKQRLARAPHPSGMTREEAEDRVRNPSPTTAPPATGTVAAPVAPHPGVPGAPPQRPATVPTVAPGSGAPLPAKPVTETHKEGQPPDKK